MEIYKKGDAKLTRRITFFSTLIIVWWGFKEFGKWLTRFEWGKQNPFGSDASFTLPLYDLPPQVGVLLAIFLTIVVALVLFRVLNGPRVAPLLVETETEVKKVSWPSKEDAIQSTIVVLVFVAVVAAFLTVVETVLRYVFDAILSL